MNKTENKMLDSIQRKRTVKMSDEFILRTFNLWVEELSAYDYNYLFRNINAIRLRLRDNINQNLIP